MFILSQTFFAVVIVALVLRIFLTALTCARYNKMLFSHLA